MYKEWVDGNYFQGACSIITDDGHFFEISQWYAQPEMYNERPLQYITDPHHVFVNNRVKCCKSGMAGMGISSKAWEKVAEEDVTIKQACLWN